LYCGDGRLKYTVKNRYNGRTNGKVEHKLRANEEKGYNLEGQQTGVVAKAFV
jgi:hypothetical protein